MTARKLDSWTCIPLFACLLALAVSARSAVAQPVSGAAGQRRPGTTRPVTPAPGRAVVRSAPTSQGAASPPAARSTTQAQDAEAALNAQGASRQAIAWSPSPPPEEPEPEPSAPSSAPIPSSRGGPYGTISVGAVYGDATVRGDRCNYVGPGVAVRVGFTLPSPGRVHFGTAYDEHLGCDQSTRGAQPFQSRQFAGDLGIDFRLGPLLVRPFATAGVLARFIPLCSALTCDFSLSPTLTTALSSAVVGQNLATVGGGIVLGATAGWFLFTIEGRAIYPIDSGTSVLSVAAAAGLLVE